MIYVSGGPTVTFDKAAEYLSFWEACGKPPEWVLEPPGGPAVDTRGFIWQGFLVRYSHEP